MFRRMRAALCAWSLRRVSRVVMLLSLMAAMGVCAGAQTSVDGAIRGDVRSVSGGAIPLGEVRVTGRETGVELRAVTDKQGEFVLARVPPGEYDVRVEAVGFEPEQVEGVVVEVGGVGEVAVRLSVAKQGAGSGLSVMNAPVKMWRMVQRRCWRIPRVRVSLTGCRRMGSGGRHLRS